MIQRLRAAWLRFKLGVGADDLLLSDYEVLIRLARRCAYDFSHAADFTPRKEDHWLGIDWNARARRWVELFAKGNPGKDYRVRIGMELDQATRDVVTMMELCDEHKIEVPPHLEERYRMPF